VVLFAGSTSAGPSAWVVAPPPTFSESAEVVLTGVTVVAPDDVWVVGAWTTDMRRTLAVHWNGSRWSLEPTPDPADETSIAGLNAVDAVGPDDIWAVGDIESPNAAVKIAPLLVHYDGVAWTEQPGPAELTGELTDIDLLTAAEGWAVGTGNSRPLILRRTAGQWQQSPVPPLAVPSSLASVFAVSPTDAWAVGAQLQNGRSAALVLHWDGVRWSQAPIPADIATVALSDVAANSATDVWAVGTNCILLCTSRVLHLTEGGWRPEITSAGVTLTAVLALSPTDVWVFGQSGSPSAVLDHIEHWDGTGFTVDRSVPPPLVTTSSDHPASALALASAGVDKQTGTMWTVGWIQGTVRTAHALFRG
jgi:hypothetical protein